MSFGGPQTPQTCSSTTEQDTRLRRFQAGAEGLSITLAHVDIFKTAHNLPNPHTPGCSHALFPAFLRLW